MFSLAGAGSIAVPLSFLVFASWLSECAPVAPFLWVVVPVAFSTAALKQMLHLLCRHVVGQCAQTLVLWHFESGDLVALCKLRK